MYYSIYSWIASVNAKRTIYHFGAKLIFAISISNYFFSIVVLLRKYLLATGVTVTRNKVTVVGVFIFLLVNLYFTFGNRDIKIIESFGSNRGKYSSQDAQFGFLFFIVSAFILIWAGVR